MAYVNCVRCGLTAYTAARWSSIDYCARCDAPLSHGAANVTPIAIHPRFRRHATPASGRLVREWRPSAA